MRSYLKNGKICVLLSLLLPMITTSKVFAWGATAHEMINTVAAETMTSSDKDFYMANLDNLVKFATVPDRSWKSSSTRQAEAPLHFMDWDHYASTAIGNAMPVSLANAQKTLGSDFIQQNGGGVWRAGQMYNQLVIAVKKGDCTRVIQMAGVLGHYVADMSMPMHFTSDYDGQSIGKKGIHAYFETTLVEKQDQGSLHDQVSRAAADGYPKSAPQSSSNAADRAVALTFREGKTALASFDRIRDIFRSATDESDFDDAALAAYLPPLMGLGASSVAQLWDQAEKDAGKSSGCVAEALNVTEPTWMPLQ